MLGIDGVLAAGLHRRYGWKLPAIAGLAAISPDWDGLTLVLGAAAFDAGHRAWGHNLLVAVGLALILCAIDYRYDPLTRLARRFRKHRDQNDTRFEPRRQFRVRELVLWLVVGTLAAMSHLAADLVDSGTETLGDWKLPLLWPFSDQKWVFPMVRWGDPWMTVIFAAGMLAMARRPHRLQLLAALSLAGVVAYIIARGVTGYP